ncbi:hypothetical protein BTA51_04635 [Hahella sp. CCB-MM4]|uniref:DUF2845 domain-containing protein n=1 Tax=Hahella sp. (strain CCB-MM4) TaxID=1926491 RepID=UPI000BC88FA1|nr:DUF2845 domain-containing protein [Hahella sp. CCB-MM4]OZG74304.1 hypothetical protein BTA51_04635 [Hahella sp. CCB-MM4]
MAITSIGKRSLLILTLGLLPSLSWGMRCGTDIIKPQDLEYEVYHKCGKPDYTSIVGYTLVGDRQREHKIERWIYEQSGDVIYILEFVGGKVTRIDWKRSPK